MLKQLNKNVQYNCKTNETNKIDIISELYNNKLHTYKK